MAADLTTHPDWRALVRAVCATPGDDLPRLVAADFLDENGHSEYAEFVRVQIELAKWTDPLKCPECGDGYDYSCEMDGHAKGGGFKPSAELGCVNDHFWKFGRLDELRRRELELIADRGYGWCDGLIGEDWKVDGGTKGQNTVAVRFFKGLQQVDLDITFSRGFVAEVRGGLTDLLGGACDQCDGRGWIGDAAVCFACQGAKTLTGVLPRLVGRQPVERVGVSDREPRAYHPDADLHDSGPQDGWYWGIMWERMGRNLDSVVDGVNRHNRNLLPKAMIDRMRNSAGATAIFHSDSARSPMGLQFPTRDSALAALSAAVLKRAGEVSRELQEVPA